MKTEELRAVQGPLKERYKERPDAALITLKAQGRLGEGITCNVQTGKRSSRRDCIRQREATDWPRARATCCLRRLSHVPV